jgi:hypothetical protein
MNWAISRKRKSRLARLAHDFVIVPRTSALVLIVPAPAPEGEPCCEEDDHDDHDQAVHERRVADDLPGIRVSERRTRDEGEQRDCDEHGEGRPHRVAHPARLVLGGDLGRLVRCLRPFPGVARVPLAEAPLAAPTDLTIGVDFTAPWHPFAGRAEQQHLGCGAACSTSTGSSSIRTACEPGSGPRCSGLHSPRSRTHERAIVQTGAGPFSAPTSTGPSPGPEVAAAKP